MAIFFFLPVSLLNNKLIILCLFEKKKIIIEISDKSTEAKKNLAIPNVFFIAASRHVIVVHVSSYLRHFLLHSIVLLEHLHLSLVQSSPAASQGAVLDALIKSHSSLYWFAAYLSVADSLRNALYWPHFYEWIACRQCYGLYVM